MSTMADKSIAVGNVADATKLDLLNRQDYISRLINITEILSINKENVCYAINGEWGVGKT